MDQDDVRVGPAMVGEVAKEAGISVEKALGILYANGHTGAHEPEHWINAEERQCITDALAVHVKPVKGGYSAEFSVACRDGHTPFARRGRLMFSRAGYSDACGSCGAATRCPWSFRVIGAEPYDVLEPAAVSVLTAWYDRRPTVNHAHLCKQCAQSLGSAYGLIQERVTADEVEADRLWRLQEAQEKRARDAAKTPAAPAAARKPVPEAKPEPAPSPTEGDDLVPSDMRLLISDKLAAALALTPHRENAKPLGDLFEVVIEPALGPMSRIRLVHEEWTAHGRDDAELDLDDARVPVLRNIAFGACDLLADSGGTSPLRVVEPSDKPLPIKTIQPSRHIRVEVNADLRPIVIDILEGKRQYETATGEAIFVRGHWTHQPCGEGGRERRVIWRQPHYRGKGHRGGRTYAFVDRA